MTLLMGGADARPCSHRPWLSLYGNRLPVPSSAAHEPVELAPIQQAIPNELMVIVFSYLDPYSLGKAALVCRQWRNLHEHPRLWERACHDAFHLAIPERADLHKLMVTKYRFSWKRMFVHHPHLRFDGLYVARNTYVRTGVVEFTSHRAVHLVSYFRYFRFLPNGTFLYRISPDVLAKVARSLAAAPPGSTAHGGTAPRLPPGGAGGREWDRNPVLCGRYVIRGSRVHCSLQYDNSGATELRFRLGLRSTHPGAHNRLDFETILTYDRETGTGTELQGGQQGDADPDAPAPDSAKAHQRGLAPCVFVPWEQVHSSPLNLPASQMDFMIA